MVDDDRHRSEQLRSKWWRAAALTCLLAGCTTHGYEPDDRSVLPAWREALGDTGSVRFGSFESGALPAEISPEHVLVIVDRNWREPERATDATLLQTLRTFVHGGGRLVLFGHAARIAHELDVESVRPDCGVYRWGFDRRALQGHADVGFAVVSGEHPQLFDGMNKSGVDERFDLTGGAPCHVPLCSWRIGSPEQATVLARLCAQRDDREHPIGAPVVLHWQVEDGEVLACGLLPALHNDVEATRENARTFVRRCVEFCEADASVLVCDVPERAAAKVATLDDAPPIVPWLAHWGWQVGLYDGDEAADVRPMDELLQDALLPSWLTGADLLELQLTDSQHGTPLAFAQRDPIEAPLSWRGNGLQGAWAQGGFRAFADEAHTRGMLLFGGLDPLPVGDRATERLVALRMHARELASIRRHGSGAFDGFGLRQWWPDRRGFGVAMVQDYLPAAAIYCAGERTPELAGAMRAVDADDGAPRGSQLAGIGPGWRDGFAPDRYPLGVLDARAVGDRWPGQGVRGGGAHGDWLTRQFNDFVRDRRNRGGAVLWRRQDPRTMSDETAAYVHGLGLEPLRAAVATPLSSTGRDGVRAAAASLLEDAPAGFGGEVDAPAAVHVLQNNWFRLLGTGGALTFDPTGLANCDEHALTISDGLLHTRLFGGRPDVDALRAEHRDLLLHGHRGAGGYGDAVRVGASRSSERRVPGLLAFDEQPKWPRAVEFELLPEPGYHELRLEMRGERGASVVAISLDSVLLRCVAVIENANEPITVPVHVATAGERVLRIEVLEGHAVALDRAQLHRAGDVGVEAEVSVAAGSRAELIERSYSSYHEESVTIATIADMPGFVVETRCRQAVRNLQVERRLSLPMYDRLVAGAGDDDPKARRMPFALASSRPGVPDLIVVPMHLQRYEHLQANGGELVWRTAPEPGSFARVGFLFCPPGQGAATLPHARRLLSEVAEPHPVDLGADGRVSLASDTPVPWNRLLRITADARTPFLVRERGIWTWRGSQPAKGGGAWLRVHHEPGDVVEIVGGPVVMARTRPGPGSLRIVAMKDPAPRSVTAMVLQPSRVRAPSVVMATDFDTVTLNGEPWSRFDGRTIYLPDVVGEYLVETEWLGDATVPSVRSTGAPLTRCEYDKQTRELVLVTAGRRDRPAGLPWTAVLRGPKPVSIENGELVDASQLHLPDDVAKVAAEQGGYLIRFRNGITTVRYVDGPQ